MYQVVSCLYQACIMLVCVRTGYMTALSRYMQDTSLIQVEKIPDTESFFQILSTLYQHRYKRDAERIRTLIFGREPLKPHGRYRADTHNNTRMHVKTRGYITDRYMPIHLYRKRHQFVQETPPLPLSDTLIGKVKNFAPSARCWSTRCLLRPLLVRVMLRTRRMATRAI